MLAELIPEGRECAFFALAALSGRGCAWLGPLMVTGMAQYTHDLRYGWVSVGVLLLLAVPPLLLLDVGRGRVDAERLAEAEAIAACTREVEQLYARVIGEDAEVEVKEEEDADDEEVRRSMGKEGAQEQVEPSSALPPSSGDPDAGAS